jgi:hypothetical protein
MLVDADRQSPVGRQPHVAGSPRLGTARTGVQYFLWSDSIVVDYVLRHSNHGKPMRNFPGPVKLS